MAIFKKSLTDYFPAKSLSWAERLLNEPPATTFLKEVVHLSDAVNHCARNFSRKKNGDFTKDSRDAYQSITISSLALLMAHFEVYQKGQFAILINQLDCMDKSDDLSLSKQLEKSGCLLTIQGILSERPDPREPGDIIAESLPGWHNADRVNSYYRLIFPKFNFYSKEIVSEIDLLWQLRHSIAHTAGVVSRVDSTKIPELRQYRDKKLMFKEGFFQAIARRFHIMLELSVSGLHKQVRDSLIPSGDKALDEEIINSIVGMESPRKSWFRANNQD